MKKRLLLFSIFLLFIISIQAANRYWVGGTGAWNDSAHWSATSGGTGGTTVPTAIDDVIFDHHSFTSAKQTVILNSNGVCHTIDWSKIDDQAVFASTPTNKLTVTGSYILSALLSNEFNGKIIFASSSKENIIATKGKLISGSWIFNGTGSWLLKDNVNGPTLSIQLLQGELNTNNQKINCSSITEVGSQSRTLILGKSTLTIENDWNFSETQNLTFNATSSEIVFKKLNAQNFKTDNDLLYGKIAMSTPLTNIVTITEVATNKCFGDCKSTIVATITGGVGPYVYQWLPGGTNNSIMATDTLKNQCQNPVNLLVQDLSTGEFASASYTVSQPNNINMAFNQTQPTCFSVCNGVITPIVTGGTQPYSYSWAPGVQTGTPFSNVCAGTYTLTLVDANACIATKTTVLAEPNVLVPIGSSTNISCFGNCNGSATITGSGGTKPYAYLWSNGATTSSISGLCPGTYTTTITDSKSCQKTYAAVVTQPNVLTLSTSKTNATCGGTCNGTATASVSGGTTPYTYTWSTGAVTTTALTSNVVGALCAGTYTITVRDANGCSKLTTVTITEPIPIAVTAGGTNISCFSLCNGTAKATVTGGTTPYTYLWSTGESTTTPSLTNTIDSLCIGTYTVTVTDFNGCSVKATTTLTQPALLIGNPTRTNITCFGLCNGTATATPTGGTAPYTYSWNTIPVKTTQSITNLCPGTYSVTVTDIQGCDTIQSITITQPTQVNPNISKTNLTCNAICNGTATVAPTGGSSPYTYLWNNGSISTSIGGLCAGSYSVTVTDVNGCSATASVTLTQPNLLTASITSTTLACNGDCNASLAAVVGGGTPLYTYLWSTGGQTTLSVTNLCAGTYTVTVGDSNGCTVASSVTIAQPPPLNLSTLKTDVSCFGLCDGSVFAIGGGGAGGPTYSWAPGGQTTPSISNQCLGTYTITLRDSKGCTLGKAVTVTQPTPLVANPSLVNNLSCAGSCNGSVISNPTGGTAPYTYSWNTVPGKTTASVINLCAGTFNVTVVDSNACSSTMPVTITQPAVLSASISNSTSSCNICNGTAAVTPAGGTGAYTYSWNSVPVQTTQTATGLCPNTSYTVTVTDQNNCTATSTVTILQTIIINITTSNTVLSCFGSCDGTVIANASGGTSPYNYLWGGPGGPYTSQAVSNLCVGSYTVNVSDAVGCFNSAIVTFTNPVILGVSTSYTDATCNGTCNGTASVTATGGTGVYAYSWNSVPVQTTQKAIGLCAGTYIVTVSDANGCTKSSSVIITEPTPVLDNLVTITTANCNKSDGDITIAPTGGTGIYTYNWSPGNPPGDGTPAISVIPAGTYTVTITDGAGCTFGFNYIVNNTAGPTLTIAHTNVSCNNLCDGSATVTAIGGAGGFTYSWSPGTQTTSAATALCGTTLYTVRVTDLIGCITIDTATVINPLLISPNPTIVNESCGGTCDGSISLIPTGGMGSYTYLWAPGGATTSSITNLCAGTYTVTVKDANSCDSVLVIPIVSPPTLTATLSSTNVLCNAACNGTATATVSGGTGAGTYSYSWSHGAGFVLPNVVNLCPGQYIVTVKDGNLCTAKDTVIITQPLVLTSTTSKINISCNASCNGMATVSATGGTLPYTYLWNPGAIGNDTASNLCPGSYNVKVTDFNGCVSNPPTVTITQPTAIVPNATFVNSTCNASCNGTATASATGGTAPYTYLWQPGNFTTQAVSNLCAGTYTVTVSDALSCSNNQIISLVDPPVLIPNTSSISPTCNNSCNGSVKASPVGGTAGYSYLWLPVNSTNQTVTNLCPATYTVTVTDVKGCTNSQTAVITNTLPIDALIGSTPANCGVCDGKITITPTTGTPAYTYLWAPAPTLGQGTAFADSVCAGIYNITITDSNGCDSLFTITLNNASGPSGEIVDTIDATCNGLCNGSGWVIPIGGLAPYGFIWNNPPSTANDTAINLCAGNYVVRVTDANACVHFSPVSINEPSPIVVAGTITNAACTGVCTGAITVTTSGGTGGYTYTWAPVPPVGQNTASVSGLCLGTYTLTTTDANLCTQTNTFVIGQTTPLAATINATTISCSSACNGMAYTTITTGTAPYTFQWNDALGQVNDTATALCAGTYNVNITDALGCNITLTTTVTATPPITANVTITDAACGLCDGQAILVPVGGTAPYTYVWSNGQTTATATALCSGLYSVNITDNTGCTSTSSVPVSNTSGPTSATISSTNASCFGLVDGAVTGITPVGGKTPYTYLWVQGGQTTPTLNNLGAGVYYVQIKDADGCSLLDSVTITQPAAISANQLITAPTCGACDGSITIAPSGAIAPYTVLWNTGSTALSLTNRCAGIYSVQLTAANGCSQNVVVPINSQNGPTVTTSSTNITCNGSCNGTATLTATGGPGPYIYLWNSVPAQATQTAVSLCAGTYFVQVTDASGCISIGSSVITTPPPIIANTTITDATCGLCDGQAILVPGGGTAPYTYLWSNGQTTATATNLCSGLYAVDITDFAGCVTNVSKPISNSGGPTSSIITSTNASCFGVCDGAVTANAPVGGTLPYTYLWIQSGKTTSTISNLCAGVHYVQITDAKGCSLTDSVTITEPTQITTNNVITPPTCNVCDGSITIAPSGGIAPYTILWNTGSTASSLTNVCAGIYSVQLTAFNGCSQNVVVPINSKTGPTVSTSSTDITCNGTCNGTVTLTATGGTGLYSYSWNSVPIQTSQTAISLCAGTYFVQVTDGNGCVSIASSVITTPPPIVFSLAGSKNPLCNGNSNGSITVVPSGGTLPYSFNWSTGGIGTVVSAISAGTYSVTVTDGNGCTSSQSTTLTNPPVLTVTSVPTNASCNFIADGAIDITVIGGTPGYIYQWSGGSTATTQDIAGLVVGATTSYTVIVTDTVGCTNTQSIILTSTAIVIANAGKDTTFCQSGTINLDASLSTGGINYQWFQMPANTNVGNTASVSINPPTGVTSYYVVVNNGTGCSDTDTLQITSNTLPIADAGNDITIVTGKNITIGGNPTGTAGSTVVWSPALKLSSITDANPVANPTTTTTYKVIVTTSQGCTAMDSIVVTVLPTIVLPDGISPNGDGANDEWIIDNIDQFPDCMVEVYNRWGELLFQSAGYKEHWNGTYKGKPLPVGTYYYIINLNDPLYPDAYTGPITILR